MSTSIQRQIIDECVARHRIKVAESAVLFKEQTGRDAPEIPADMEEFAAVFTVAAAQSKLPGMQYFFVDVLNTVKNMLMEHPEEFLKKLQDENCKL